MPINIPELTPIQQERFWSRVDVRSADGCWPWLDWLNNKNYGQININNRHYLAHRVSMALDGRDPIGAYACHACDNPPCVNPAHLFVGTRQDNMQDCVKKGRNIRGSAHKLAKLTDDNVRAIRSDIRYQRIIQVNMALPNL